jgi:hypothetical protein
MLKIMFPPKLKMKTPIKENIRFNSTGVLKTMIPPESKVDSFLFYGGDIEFKLADSGRHLRAHTNNYLVHEFWDCVLDEPSAVAMWAENLSSLLEDDPVFSKEKMFSILQSRWHIYSDSYIRAGMFFLLNRYSDVGLISSGKMSATGLSHFSLLQMRRFKVKNFEILLDTCNNYLETLLTIKDTDYLLFPAGKFSYNLFEEGKSKAIENTTVDHKALYKILQNEKHRWILLYKPHPCLFDLYSDYNITMIDNYGRRTNKKSKCEELIIVNF